ncbi:DUF6782 family putative metallopeptidase [Enterococcus olivae]
MAEKELGKAIKTFEEKLSYARSRNLLSVVASLGIQTEKVGTTIRNAEHPSQVFYPRNNRFVWFSQDISGDVITFVQMMTDKNFKEAIEFLNTENLMESEIVVQEEPKKPFHYYVRETTESSLAKQYLIEERKINTTIVNRLFDERYLVQAEYMPYYPESKEFAPCLVAKWERHGELVGGTIQGLTIDEEHFGKHDRDKRIMGRSESNFGWNYTLGHPNKIIFAESVIDLLSYWSLHPELDNCYLVDLEGLKENSFKEFLKELIIEKKGTFEKGLILAIDNDVAGQLFMDKLSKYQFFEQDNFIIEQPMNNAVLSEHHVIYQRVGQQYQVDPLALAAVHKAYTNGSKTNQLANVWKNDQFFGTYLKPTEKPTKINTLTECEKAALALQKVQSTSERYNFVQLTTAMEDTPATQAMGDKIQRMYQMFQKEGMLIVDEILKDQNDLLKEKIIKERKGEEEMAINEEPFSEKVEEALRIISDEQVAYELDTVRLSEPASFEEIGKRQAIYLEFQQVLRRVKQKEPTELEQEFVNQILEIEKPVQRVFEQTKTESALLGEIVNDHRLVTHFLTINENTQETSLFDLLPQPAQENFVLGLDALENELNTIDTNQLSHTQTFSVSLHLNYLKDTLYQTGFLINDGEHFHLTDGLNGIVDTDWLKQIAIQLLEFDEDSTMTTAKQILNTRESFNASVVRQNPLPKILEEFKTWAQNYEGLGKEYVPKEEIDALQLTVENNVLLESEDTWFDSLEDYLLSHKERPFGESAAFTNASLFLDLIDAVDRNHEVLLDQVQSYQKEFFEGHYEISTATNEVFDHLKVSSANRIQPSNELVLLPESRESGLIDENTKTVLVLERGNGNEQIFENFSEFVEYVETTNETELTKVKLEKEELKLVSELKVLKEWMKEYDGRDKEYIPVEEIQQLKVKVTDEKEVVLLEEMNGSYTRQYASVRGYFESFEGNTWKETYSFESAKNYYEHRNEPMYLRYELVKEKLLHVKEEQMLLHTHSKEALGIEIWENIHCVSESQLKKNANQKLLYYQDPTRNSNPIYFHSIQDAQQFVDKFVKEQQQSSPTQKPLRAFFRRERKEQEAKNNSKNNQTLEDNFLGISHPKVVFGIEKSRAELKNQELFASKSSVKTIGKTSNELIAAAKEGVKEFVHSDTYKEYLQVMSKFHNYSWRNTMLIFMQKPDVSKVAGFQTWKKTFDRHVVKGAKAIRILAPIIKKEEVEKVVNGKKQLVQEKRIVSYRPVNVFDVSQTEGKELPKLVKELTGDIKQYSKLFEAIAATTDFPIEFDNIVSDAKGYCDMSERKIVLQKGMSETQTIKTLVHEVTHSLMHSNTASITSNRQTVEIEAESTAFVVCAHFGLDTSDYSFGYLAGWSRGKALEEMTDSFAKIQKQSDKLIESISINLKELTKELSQEKGVSQKIELARSNSELHNQVVKKPQVRNKKSEIKPPKER